METLREDLLRGIEASMLAKPNVSKRVAARQKRPMTASVAGKKVSPRPPLVDSAHRANSGQSGVNPTWIRRPVRVVTDEERRVTHQVDIDDTIAAMNGLEVSLFSMPKRVLLLIR